MGAAGRQGGGGAPREHVVAEAAQRVAHARGRAVEADVRRGDGRELNARQHLDARGRAQHGVDLCRWGDAAMISAVYGLRLLRVLAFLRCTPGFLAAVGASWGWAERLV